MILEQIFQWACTILKLHQIDDYQLEARILLGAALQPSTTDLYNQWYVSLTKEQITNIRTLIHRRINREPSAYITSHKEFYGIDFYVDNRVLIPRPETEFLVETAINYIIKHSMNCDHHFSVADIGTGCGAIAIALAMKFPDIHLFATDISNDALEVAGLNSQRLNISEKIILLQGDLLNPISQPVDLILANLPYIQSSAINSLAPEIRNYEPRSALDGGTNGLELIKRLLETAAYKIKSKGAIILEFGSSQESELLHLIDCYFSNTNVMVHSSFDDRKYLVSIET